MIRIYFLLAMITLSLSVKAIEVKNLKTEYLRNPIGIDAEFPRLSWELQVDKGNVFQTAYQIRCAENAADLHKPKAQLWDSGKVESDETFQIKYSGKALKSGQRIYWQVRVWDENGKLGKWSKPAFFEMGLLKLSDWKAHWITAEDQKGKIRKTHRSSYLRKSFDIKKKVASARAYVSALGFYELRINGEKVGNDWFTPGWTSYENRVQYQVYDVSKHIVKGENVVASVLGNGWYREFRGQNKNNPTAFILQLELRFADGTFTRIVTDESWQSSVGAIQYSSIYNGEIYNATQELLNWDRVGELDKTWNGVESVETRTTLVANQNETMTVKNELQAKTIQKAEDGSYVIDFGQNMVGVVELSFDGSGHRGDTIKVMHTEVLDQDGGFYIESLRRAKQTNTYIAKGETAERYSPRFTFQGFRYVKVIGFSGQLKPENIKAKVIHSDLERTGTFECSDSLVNQLFQNTIWGQKGNFVDVPIDCPQRDERLGWTADTQVFTPAGCFNMQAAAFYMKWLKDLALDQNKDGSVPRYIPAISHGGGQAGWADAAVIVPWYLYQFYGDTAVLRRQYVSMKRHIDFMKKRAGNNLLIQKGKQYGDWLSYKTENDDHYMGASTDKNLIATAYFAYSTALVAEIAEILGKKEDAQIYLQLSGKVKKAFRQEYMTANGRLMSNTQTAYCMALEFDLVPEHLRTAAVEFLVEDVRKMKHITTGFLGTPMISFVLSEYGFYDEAYMLLMRKEYPGWLYPVTKGATTIWERWDGIKPDGSFQNPGMNSFNHYAYGAIANWLYQVVAGIRISEENAGFSKVIIEPHPGGNLTWAKGSYQSIRGQIKSSWKLTGEQLVLDVEIPANTSGLVRIVANKTDRIEMNGKVLNPEDLSYVKSASFNGFEIEVGNGAFSFVRGK